MDHKSVEVRDTKKYGLALYTAGSIRKDEVVVELDGKID